jgi:hypothetical protein
LTFADKLYSRITTLHLILTKYYDVSSNIISISQYSKGAKGFVIKKNSSDEEQLKENT